MSRNEENNFKWNNLDLFSFASPDDSSHIELIAMETNLISAFIVDR